MKYDSISLQKPGGIIALLDEAWYAFFLVAISWISVSKNRWKSPTYEVVKQDLNLAPMAHATLGNKIFTSILLR